MAVAVTARVVEGALDEKVIRAELDYTLAWCASSKDALAQVVVRIRCAEEEVALAAQNLKIVRECKTGKLDLEETNERFYSEQLRSAEATLASLSKSRDDDVVKFNRYLLYTVRPLWLAEKVARCAVPATWIEIRQERDFGDLVLTANGVPFIRRPEWRDLRVHPGVAPKVLDADVLRLAAQAPSFAAHVQTYKELMREEPTALTIEYMADFLFEKYSFVDSLTESLCFEAGPHSAAFAWKYGFYCRAYWTSRSRTLVQQTDFGRFKLGDAEPAHEQVQCKGRATEITKRGPRDYRASEPPVFEVSFELLLALDAQVPPPTSVQVAVCIQEEEHAPARRDALLPFRPDFDDLLYFKQETDGDDSDTEKVRQRRAFRSELCGSRD